MPITKPWLKSQYKFKTRQWEVFQNVINVLNLLLLNVPFAGIPLHINIDNCRYAAIQGNKWDYYYDEEETIEILDKLLMFQFDQNLEKVKRFKLDVIRILDKKTPKLNCLEVIGEPCSGKNFFFHAILDACINKGQIGNYNRYTSFPLQDEKDRRAFYGMNRTLNHQCMILLKCYLLGIISLPK